MIDDKDLAGPAAPPLGLAAFGGAVHTGIAQLVRAALMIASTIIVARLLTPDDYGVVAMAAPVLTFVLLFQDLGLSAATVQARSMSAEQSTTLFWLTMAASAAITVLLLAAAPLVAWFYDDVRVGHVTAASAVIVLVTGLALQHSALLARELRFREIARTVVAGAATSFVATLLLALWLRSYWAIFLGHAAGVAAQTVATWIVQRWRPGRRASAAGVRSMLRLGGSVAGFDLMNFFARNMDFILIGRVWGAGALGLYERSFSLMMAPILLIRGPVAKVVLPVLSRLHGSPERYRLAYLTSLRAVLFVTAPAAAVALATSEALVPLLLGETWRDAAPIFFWLALGSLYLPVASSTGVLFVSTARGRSLMAWGLLSSGTTVLAFVVGLAWGPVGVAKAYVLATLVQTIVVVPWAARGTAVKAADVAWLFLPFLLVAAMVWTIVRSLYGAAPPLGVIVAAVPLAYLATLASLRLTAEGRDFLHSIAKLARQSLPATRRRALATHGDA